MPERRYTYGGELQIRQDAGSPSPGTISGAIVVYGDVAPNPFGGLGPERMAAGAWGPDVERQAWTANLMHNARQDLGGTPTGELRLTDSDTALTATLVLPDTEPGRQTAMLARKGVLRGLSGEFDIVNQYLGSDGVRTVVRAAGDAVGVVDRPAYGQSQIQIRQAEMPDLQIRQSADDGISAFMPYGTPLLVSLARSEYVQFEPPEPLNLDGEIYALLGGDYSQPLGGTAAGSLELRQSADGLDIRIPPGTLPATGYAADFRGMIDARLARGITAGWMPVDVGPGQVVTTARPEGGNLITVSDGAMLCELRFRTRSTSDNTRIQTLPPIRQRRRWVY